MSTTLIVAFLGVALLAYVTPGPDWFVVLQRAASGRRSGILAALGVQSGLVVHVTAAAVGVSALLLASATAFTVVKLAGAAYLAYLGVSALIRAGRRARGHAGGEPMPGEGSGSGLMIFRQAFVANVLNPKAALFFVAVLPQFLTPSQPVARQVLLLGVIDIAIGLVWWALFVGAVAHFSRLLSGRRSRIIIDGGSGIALTGLAVALAVTKPART